MRKCRRKGQAEGGVDNAVVMEDSAEQTSSRARVALQRQGGQAFYPQISQSVATALPLRGTSCNLGRASSLRPRTIPVRATAVSL